MSFAAFISGITGLIGCELNAADKMRVDRDAIPSKRHRYSEYYERSVPLPGALNLVGYCNKKDV